MVKAMPNHEEEAREAASVRENAALEEMRRVVVTLRRSIRGDQGALRGRGRCFRCNQPGHYVAECPVPPAHMIIAVPSQPVSGDWLVMQGPQ